jgi:hypothetical protein
VAEPTKNPAETRQGILLHTELPSASCT